ncbi:MAG TPA: AbrB/MazE/SpoVT family DNA-binding domain-containing protein [Acidisarcina sp.]
MEQARTRLSAKGRIVIPAGFREALGLEIGDEVLLRMEGDELRISTLRGRIREAQTYVRQFVKPGRRLSDELIAERREAGKLE